MPTCRLYEMNKDSLSARDIQVTCSSSNKMTVVILPVLDRIAPPPSTHTRTYTHTHTNTGFELNGNAPSSSLRLLFELRQDLLSSLQNRRPLCTDGYLLFMLMALCQSSPPLTDRLSIRFSFLSPAKSRLEGIP